MSKKKDSAEKVGNLCKRRSWQPPAFMFTYTERSTSTPMGTTMCQTLRILCLLTTLTGIATTAQAVTRDDVLGMVRISGALIACGYNDEGVKAGNAAVNALPLVGLHDKSPEVAEAFVRGKQNNSILRHPLDAGTKQSRK